MNRIAELRKAHGYSQASLGKALGAAQNTISNWEKGNREPDNDTLLRMSEIFGVSVDVILGREPETKHADKPFPFSGGTQRLTRKDELSYIPILGRVPGGAPLSAVTDIEGLIDIPAEWTRSADYFALRIKGESMEPRIWDGDLVIVRRQEECASGDICIVGINGEDATCKIVKFKDDGVSLVSINPEFDPIFYSAAQIRDLPVYIVGKVVEVRAKL